MSETVKEKALYFVNNGDFSVWEDAKNNGYEKWMETVKEIEEKLLSPQPKEKKVRKYNFYVCKWNIGDVYAYQLNSEEARQQGLYGRYFLFHKIGETKYGTGHIVPIVRVKITSDNELPRCAIEFNKLEYVQTAVDKPDEMYIERGKSFVCGKYVKKYVTDAFGLLPIYRLILINISNRTIPRNLVYVGNYGDVIPPNIEYVPEDLCIPRFL